MVTKSWAIVEIATNRAVTETWDKDKAAFVNDRVSTHKAVPIVEWIHSLSGSSNK